MGAHIDGYIAIVAHTFVIGGEVSEARAKVLKATYTAAEVAARMLKDGAKNEEVTAAIQKVRRGSTAQLPRRPPTSFLPFSLLSFRLLLPTA